MPSILEVPSTGPLLATEADALDVLGSAYGSDAEVIVLLASRLAPEFWELRNGLAGAFVQKFVNYGRRLAILGDISEHVGRSKALTDFVRESNRRGGELLFVLDRDELEAVLNR